VLSADSSAAPPASSGPIAVSPADGTPDASPETQISFLGPAGTRVSHVSVVGTRTGVHHGVLRAYSTGTGESFLPARPFTAGERVTVAATVRVGPAVYGARTSFVVAHQAPVSQSQFPHNPGDPSAVQHYASAPSIAPSTVRITTAARAGSSPGDLFLAPYQGDGEPGPMIVDQTGRLVWFHRLPAGYTATNFRIQQYQGRPVLSWWQGRVLEVGFGQGEDVIYSTGYRPIGRIRAGNGYHADLHEIRLESDGTAWIDAFDPIHTNLTSFRGGPNDVLTDSVVQEVDIRTGLVMWEWHALGHVPVTESHNPPPEGHFPWDYVHVNSIDPLPGGRVLLSARNTWTLYDVDMRTGAVTWRLGGDHSSFTIGPGARFYWQHDAEMQPNGQISVFDNGSDPGEEPQSRGLLLTLDPHVHTVTLARQFVNPHAKLLSSSQGDMIALPGGNWLLGYGGLPNFTEFSPTGQVLLDGTLGRNVQDFRTYLAPWSAPGEGSPALAASAAAGRLVVSASWNGATDVASWRVLTGPAPGLLAASGQAPAIGFQTSISVAPRGPYVRVQALDATGAVLGSSGVVRG